MARSGRRIAIADAEMCMSVVPVCSPSRLEGRHPLKSLDDLRFHTLIQVSSRLDEWKAWLRAAGIDESGFAKELGQWMRLARVGLAGSLAYRMPCGLPEASLATPGPRSRVAPASHGRPGRGRWRSSSDNSALKGFTLLKGVAEG